MAYVVAYNGEMSEHAYRTYLLLVGRRLLAQGSSLDQVPRTPANGRTDRWLYVFQDENAARSLAEELKRDTEDDNWSVQPVEGPVEQGPIQPITIEVGRDSGGIGFRLDPLSRKALRLRFPGAALHQQVWIDTEQKSVFSGDGLRDLALQVLPLLTGLSAGQLRRFGGVEIINPVTEEVLVPLLRLEDPTEARQLVTSTTHCDRATSPDHCTAEHSD